MQNVLYRYELEKKAASNPKPSMMYRTIRTADGTLIQRPVASVRPMQHGGTTGGNTRWIPADVWQRQGMTAQEMTLPLGKNSYLIIELINIFIFILFFSRCCDTN